MEHLEKPVFTDIKNILEHYHEIRKQAGQLRIERKCLLDSERELRKQLAKKFEEIEFDPTMENLSRMEETLEGMYNRLEHKEGDISRFIADVDWAFKNTYRAKP